MTLTLAGCNMHFAHGLNTVNICGQLFKNSLQRFKNYRAGMISVRETDGHGQLAQNQYISTIYNYMGDMMKTSSI